MIGRTISHYRITGLLGQGGMGVVYEAQDLTLRRTVALKFLPPHLLGEGPERARFLREARSTAALSHPNVCHVHEIAEAEGQLFIAMERIDGRTLAERIASGSLDPPEAVALAIGIASGLQEAHAKGIVHRDVKPANVMIDSRGQARILDFGLARLPGLADLTRPGTVAGTVAYMSPEQVRGEAVDGRSDIWSLGVVLFEMLTGQRPFSGEHGPALMYAIAQSEPPSLAGLRPSTPPRLAALVARMLAKDRSERHRDMGGLLDDLHRVERELSPGAPAMLSTVLTTASHPRTRIARPALLAAFAVPVALLAAVAWLVLRPAAPPGQPTSVAVINFENLTGDPSLDYLAQAIPSLLISSLEESPRLRVTSWERMDDLLAQAGHAGEAITKELGFELCRREGVRTVVVGSLVRAGETFVTEAKVLDVATKRLLDSGTARGRGLESILEHQIDELGRRIARGLALVGPAETETPRTVAAITTNSLEAYRLYMQGRDALERLYYPEAVRLLEQAVAFDSTSALALGWLARAYHYMSSPQERNSALIRAQRQAGRAGRRDRLYIEAEHAYYLEGDLARRIELLEQLLREYPQEKMALMLLTESRLYAGTGRRRLELALVSAEQVLALDPLYAPGHNRIAYILLDLGRHEEAERHFQRYAELVPTDANPHDGLGDLLFVRGDLEGAAAAFRRALALRPDFFPSMNNLAYVCAAQGNFREAARWWGTCSSTASGAGWRSRTTVWRSVLALLQGQEGRAAALCDSAALIDRNWMVEQARLLLEARRGEVPLLPREPSDTTQAVDIPAHLVTEALALTLAGRQQLARGDVTAARAVETKLIGIAAEAGRRSDWIGAQLRCVAVLFRAEMALADGDPRAAIAIMERDYEMQAPRLSRVWTHNLPLDRDVLARARAAAGDTRGALAAYADLLTNGPARGERTLPNPIYLFRRALLLESADRKAEAISCYERFLELWAQADPEHPEPAEARRRLARLRN